MEVDFSRVCPLKSFPLRIGSRRAAEQAGPFRSMWHCDDVYGTSGLGTEFSMGQLLPH